MLVYSRKLKNLARQHRRNPTDAGQLLWSKIRRKQLKDMQFCRQRIIGDYIVDFYCPRANLVIEIDGGQHYIKEGQQKDRIRDDYLNSRGLTVIRFSNMEVLKNIEGVIQSLQDIL